MPTNLADLRMQGNLSTETLARKAGVSEQTVRDIEQGETRQSHPRTIRKIAEALKVQPGEIAEFAHRYPPGASQPDGPRPLREIRQQAYLAVTDLATLSEVSYSTITAIEIHTQIPRSPATMRKIAGALDVQVSDITEFEVKGQPENVDEGAGTGNEAS